MEPDIGVETTSVSSEVFIVRRLRLLITAALLVLAQVVPVRADVIAPQTLFALLDHTQQLKRLPSPPDHLNGWRYYAVKGTNVEGYVGPEYDDYGFLRDGKDLLIVPFQSGGSGAVFAALLFTAVHGAPKFIGYIPSPSGHLTISIEEGQLVAGIPNYAAGDPNCCPSSRTYARYMLSGIKLKKVGDYTERYAK